MIIVIGILLLLCIHLVIAYVRLIDNSKVNDQMCGLITEDKKRMRSEST